MQRINKKASTQIIIVLTIISLSISSIALVYNLFNKQSEILMSNEECFDIKIKEKIIVKDFFYNESSEEIRLILENNYFEKIEKLRIIINFEKETETWSCGSCCSSCNVLEGGKKEYYLDAKNLGKPKQVLLEIDGCISDTKKINIE